MSRPGTHGPSGSWGGFGSAGIGSCSQLAATLWGTEQLLLWVTAKGKSWGPGFFLLAGSTSFPLSLPFLSNPSLLQS